MEAVADLQRVMQTGEAGGKPICVGLELEEPEHGCAEQRAWGKCDDTFMVRSGYCERTCGRCQVRAPTLPRSCSGRSLQTSPD